VSALAIQQAVLPFAEPAAGEGSLDAVIAATWSGLARHRLADCPVCGEEMAPEYGAHALPIGGRCRACGTTLR
jgi:hypothetical protein